MQSLEAVLKWEMTPACRRVHLLSHFGETFDATRCGGMCDFCTNPRSVKLALAEFEYGGTETASRSRKPAVPNKADADMYYEPNVGFLPMREETGIISAAQLLEMKTEAAIERATTSGGGSGGVGGSSLSVTNKKSDPIPLDARKKVTEGLIEKMCENHLLSGGDLDDDARQQICLTVFQQEGRIRKACIDSHVVYKGKIIAITRAIANATELKVAFDMTLYVSQLINGTVVH